jgi:serine protease Do
VALGTIIDPRGYILTKASEMTGKIISVKLRDGTDHPASIVVTRNDLDLVCLKIDAPNLKAVVFADTPTVDVGEWVASPGMPDKPVISVGIVSTPERKIIAKSGMLGVRLDAPDAPTDNPDAVAAKGAKITEVVPDSAAARAGLKADDVILKVNGKEAADADDLKSIIHSYEVNADVTLTVLRGGKEQEFKATLGDQAADPGSLMQNAEEKMLSGSVSKRSTNFPQVIQHDTVLRREDCGGPLVDLEGKVLGINIARAGRTESYAIPADYIKPILLKLDGAATQPSTQPVVKVSAPAKK